MPKYQPYYEEEGGSIDDAETRHLRVSTSDTFDGADTVTDTHGQEVINVPPPLLTVPPPPMTPPVSNNSIDSKKRASFFQRYKCWIITGSILLAVVVIAIILCIVLLPQIAQGFMNMSQVEFSEVSIQNPTEAGFNASIQGSISRAGPFNAQTKPMMLQIMYGDAVMGQMDMPAMDLVGGYAALKVDGFFAIQNQSAFQEFNKQLVREKQVEWRLVGDTSLTVMNSVHIDGLKFNKRVTLQGMNNFGAVKVENFTLAGETEIAVNITTKLENVSPISIEMGDLTFDMFYYDMPIGRVQASNVTIESGENTLLLFGKLTAPTGKNASRHHISDMFSKYVSGRTAIVNARGVATNETGMPVWLIETVKSIDMDVPLEAPEELKLIKNVTLEGMEMNFVTQDLWRPILSASAVNVTFGMPFDFPVKVLMTAMDFVIMNAEQEPLAYGKSAFTEVSHKARDPMIYMNLPQSELTIPTEKQQLFRDFVRDLFLLERQSYYMEGTAEVVAETPLGEVLLTDVKFGQSMSALGMQALKPYAKVEGRVSNPVIKSTNVTKGYPDMIAMKNPIILHSASDVICHLGDTTLDLKYKDEIIGYTILRNLSLYFGDNEVVTESYYKPVGERANAVGMELLSNFMNRIPSYIVMKGRESGSSLSPVLDLSLSYVDLQSPFPGLSEKIVRESTMKLNLFKPASKEAKASFVTANPFGDAFDIVRMTAQISFRNTSMASMNVSASDEGQNGSELVRVPAMTTISTPYLPVYMDNPLGRESLKALGKDITGNLYVSVTSQITARLGEYPLQVQYSDPEMLTDIDFF